MLLNHRHRRPAHATARLEATAQRSDVRRRAASKVATLNPHKHIECNDRNSERANDDSSSRNGSDDSSSTRDGSDGNTSSDDSSSTRDGSDDNASSDDSSSTRDGSDDNASSDRNGSSGDTSCASARDYDDGDGDGDGDNSTPSSSNSAIGFESQCSAVTDSHDKARYEAHVEALCNRCRETNRSRCSETTRETRDAASTSASAT